MKEPKIFYRRNLPHYQPPFATFFVTFNLAGSLPLKVVKRLKEEYQLCLRKIAKIENEKEKEEAIVKEWKRYFANFDDFLDQSESGDMWLKNPEVATLVKEAIHYRDKDIYDLITFTIMPNHVHMVFGIEKVELALDKIMHSLKRFTAFEANKILARAGKPFWQHESYDHVVRNEEEFNRIIAYVLNNPVKAGLVNNWENWEWSYIKK